MDWLSDKLVVANWKMHSTLAQAVDFAVQLDHFYKSSGVDTSCVICPPYTMLDRFYSTICSDRVFLGGQHCSPNDFGAYTGDISADMLRDVGCKFVIVAHSERRHFFRETYRVAKHQCIQAARSGLIPILCVGESDKEDYEMSVIEQLDDACIKDLPGRAIIAYEPVWAIGGNTEPDVEHIKKAIAVIKKEAPMITVLYGGSVKPSNVSSLLDISDGVLVGSASLSINDFCDILSVCEKRRV